jgi:alkanesulfonate monooxygenase SsuD/methylene tetrahydromethanopterin reductase-like flavin-dependent oxidoreductase (luciferase family)
VKFGYFTHVWNKAGMTPAERYEQLWRELALADGYGFEYGFCVEHHFRPHESWMSAPNLFALAGGMRTRQMRLGGMGHVVPLHHPLRLAEEIATVDQMIGGRLEVGLVSGVTPYMFGPFNVDFQTRRARLLEFVALFKKVYTDGEPFEFEGPFHRFKDIRLHIAPAQRPHPPLWLETRAPETLEICAREGMHTGYFFLFPREDVAPAYRDFLAKWKLAGWPHKPNIAYAAVIYVDETDEKAYARGLAHAGRAYRGLFPPGLDDATLRKAQDAQADRYLATNDPGPAEVMRNVLDPDWLLERDLIFVGSPDTVARKLKECAVSGVFNTVFGEFNFSDLPEDDLMRSIRLFGAEVMPKLRGFEPF